MRRAGLIAGLLAWAVPPVAMAQMAPSPAASAPAAAAAAADADEALLGRLVPDSALAHPEDWAKAPPAPSSPPVMPDSPAAPASAGAPFSPSVPAAPDEAVDAGATLAPSSPLADWPGFTLGWPDASADAPALAGLPADGESSAPLPLLSTLGAGEKPGAVGRLDRLAAGRVVLAWHTQTGAIPERAELEARFRGLSALQGMTARQGANLPELAVHAAADRDVLERLLRAYGYYDAEATQTLVNPPAPGDQASPTATGQADPFGLFGHAGDPLVRFDIVPGTRYRFGVIDLGGLAATGSDGAALRKSFGIAPGDPLHADAIPEQTQHLQAALGESGYAFAKIAAPELTVDHLREQGDLSLPVSPGGKYSFGAITTDKPRFLPARHLARIARFRQGQTYKASEVEDLRRAILATGLVSSLTVTPREVSPPVADAPGTVALDVAMTPAPPRTIAGAIGYDTAQGFRLEGSWEHRNLFPPEGALRLRGVAGTHEQLAGVTFRRANFHGRDRVLTLDVYADNATLPAYAARGVDASVTYERQTTLLFQKPWSWSVGAEAAASAEREGVPSGIITGRSTYVTLALPLRATFDRSNDLLDPTHGYRVGVRLSPELSQAHGGQFTYVRSQFDASWYAGLMPGVVLATRVRLGSIFGAGLEDIAPSRRLYAGGGGSIRGFGYMLVGPRNTSDQPEGGRSLYEASGEVRINTGLFHNALAVVPFLDTGGAGTGTVPGFTDVRYGAGVGLRYQTGFGPVRLDVGTPLDPRPGDSRVGVYITLGQAF